MKTALVTGAYGYLGSLLRARLEADGWSTTALVRTPRDGDRAIRWELGEIPDATALSGADALVHCAYDFAPRATRELWATNVTGSQRLLQTAHDAGVSRLLFVSSMSAYEGTKQAYGRGKLAVEALATRLGGVVVRPGLVYGDAPRGMAGTLTALTRLPIVPVIGGATARQFPVHEDDLAAAVLRILDAPTWTPEVVGIAQPRSVGFTELLRALAARAGRRPRLLPVPWPAVLWALRLAEAARLPVPLRADSLLGLVRPAPNVPASAAFPDLHASLRTLEAR
jgi:nucleoside-diphosphate-sugar epimerase